MSGPDRTTGAPSRDPDAPPALRGEPEPTVALPTLDAVLAEDDAAATGPPEPRNHGENPGRRRYLAPGLLAGAALVLVLGAYGAGKVFSAQMGDTAVASAAGQEPSVSLGEGAGPPSGEPSKPAAAPTAYGGPVEAASVEDVEASCQAGDSVDDGGNSVSYAPDLAFDGDLTTAWRCEGGGADRYAENNRITEVRWVFADGTEVQQRMDGSADNRDLRTQRIPVTVSDEVELQVVQAGGGSRDMVAVSEVWIGSAGR